jgi:hypothetical protein
VSLQQPDIGTLVVCAATDKQLQACSAKTRASLFNALKIKRVHSPTGKRWLQCCLYSSCSSSSSGGYVNTIASSSILQRLNIQIVVAVQWRFESHKHRNARAPRATLLNLLYGSRAVYTVLCCLTVKCVACHCKQGARSLFVCVECRLARVHLADRGNDSSGLGASIYPSPHVGMLARLWFQSTLIVRRMNALWMDTGAPAKCRQVRALEMPTLITRMPVLMPGLGCVRVCLTGELDIAHVANLTLSHTYCILDTDDGQLHMQNDSSLDSCALT